jgi:hypothetical protein
MPYVDGYVIPIAKKNVAAYVRMAKKASKIFKEHGALEFRECVGEDLNASWGTPYTRLLKSLYAPAEAEAQRDAFLLLGGLQVTRGARPGEQESDGRSAIGGDDGRSCHALRHETDVGRWIQGDGGGVGAGLLAIGCSQN